MYIAGGAVPASAVAAQSPVTANSVAHALVMFAHCPIVGICKHRSAQTANKSQLAYVAFAAQEHFSQPGMVISEQMDLTAMLACIVVGMPGRGGLDLQAETVVVVALQREL